MILAGDIGGTKTILALFPAGAEASEPLRLQVYPSREHADLETLVEDFLGGADPPPEAACFGVAGPVDDGRSRITNLPWVIDAETLAKRFEIPSVTLLNDLQAVATAVPHLPTSGLHPLQQAPAEPEGVIGVIAPGTGLGEAFLTWTGSAYRAWPSEGGHVSFAPATERQRELLSFLEPRFGHVSLERVCSGSGFPSLVDFLRETGRHPEPAWLGEALAGVEDPTPILIEAGLEGRAPLCEAALDLFVEILGGAVGNLALKLLSTGGIFLGGGLPPRLLPRLEQPDFLAALRDKGRFEPWVRSVPVSVILEPQTALRGAAWHAQTSGRSPAARA